MRIQQSMIGTIATYFMCKYDVHCMVIGYKEKKNGTFVEDLVYFEGNKKIITKAITKFSVLDRKKIYSPNTK